MKAHDLLENRGRPQTPCPLVHPFPNFVPNPTKNPERAKPSKDNPSIYFKGESYKSASG